ncbi:MAG: glycosyltransferase family 4 protein, partial [Terriglobales bacterium]
MRIVWVLDRLGLGGAERLALRFAAGAAAASGLELELIALRPSPEPLERVWGQEWEAATGRVRELGMRRLADPAGWLRLFRLWRGSPPALVHTHLRYATIWGGAAARVLGIPYITTVHLGPGPEISRRQVWAAGLERVGRRGAARVVYVSEAQRQAWRRVHPAAAAREAAVVIPNGVA